MKKWAGWLTLIMIVAVTVELTSFAIYKIILVPRAAFLVYTPPPLPDQASYEQYLARREPLVRADQTAVPRKRSRICRICSGPVRQQPPMIAAPALRHSRLWVPNSVGIDSPCQRLATAS